MICQWADRDKPHIYLPLGPIKYPLKYMIDRGAQISLNTPRDAEKLDIGFKRNRVHAPQLNGQSNLCYTAKVCVCLSGERQWTSHTLAIREHEENILGYSVFKGEFGNCLMGIFGHSGP